MKTEKKNRFSNIFLFYLPLTFFLLQALFPVYWMISSSFKAPVEFYAYRQSIFPVRPALQHYLSLFRKTQFLKWFRNSILVSGSTTFISVFIGGLAGYALARLRFRGKWSIGRGVLATYLVPRALLFIPLFTVLKMFLLHNSAFSLILTYPTFAAPFCAWLLTGYFKSIPGEIEECAMIDGATRLQVLTHVVFPLAIPGILSAAVFTFTLSWNEFLYAFIFIANSRLLTIPVGVSLLQIGDLVQWGIVLAASVIGSVPVVIVYAFLLRYFVAGLTAGAVKG